MTDRTSVGASLDASLGAWADCNREKDNWPSYMFTSVSFVEQSRNQLPESYVKTVVVQRVQKALPL